MKKYLFFSAVMLLVQLSFAQQPDYIPNITGQVIIGKGMNGGPTNVNEDHFGSAVANIGDLDEDGVEDIVVGANGDDNGGTGTNNYGCIYICFMNDDKTVKSSVKIGKATSGIGSDIATGDNFGADIAGLGDLDGDGNLDIVVGSPGSDITSFSNSGAIYIIFLNKSGGIVSYKRIVRGTNGGPTTIKAASGFGTSVTNLGDINNDSIPDIAVGGYTHDGPSSGNENGAVWVLRMNASGQVANSQIITKSTGWSVVLNNSDRFGISSVCPGDLNDDGINDLLVGCQGDDEAGANLGCLYLLYLDSSGLVVSYKKYVQPFFRNIFQHSIQTSFGKSLEAYDLDANGQPEFIVGSNPNEAAIYIISTDTAENITDMKKYSSNLHWNTSISGTGTGVSLALLNDIDKDGKTELLAGAFVYDTPSMTNDGAMFVVEMDSVITEVQTGDVLEYRKYGELSDSIATLAQNDLFGSSVCDLGDVNGDGFHDIAVGAYGDDDGGTSAKGAVYIIFLDSLQRRKDVQKISSIAGGFGSGLDNNDDFGKSVCAPGDLDGDNIPDLMVGAHLDDDGGADRGCVWVVYLNNDGTVKGKHKISSTRGGFGGTLSNSCQFGVSVAAIGDINNDGIGDLAVGANRDDDGGQDRGAVWILFMNAADSVGSYQKISDTQGDFTETFSGNNVFFGASLCRADDLNGDGKEDLVVGSSMDGTGAVYVLYLDTLGKVSAAGFKKINNAASNFPVTIQTGKGFGSSVAVLNDIDGNGYKEIVIGNLNYTSLGTDKGAVWVAFPDSAYNILYTRLIGEEAPYFNATLLLDDKFGTSVCSYQVFNGTERLFAGSECTENSTHEGAIFSWYPMAMDSMTLRELAFGSPDPATFPDRLPKAYKGFYDLNRTLDGGMYYPEGYYLKFKYYEEYRSGEMRYNIYNSNQTFVTSSALDPPVTLYNEVTGTENKSIGQNYFRLNFGWGGLGLPIGNYILETLNDKGERMYLRFVVNKKPVSTSPIGLGVPLDTP